MHIQNDQIQRFLFEDLPVRGEIIRLHESYQTALSNHYYPTEVGQLLGQGLTAAALLSETMKYEGRLIIQTQSAGFVDPLVVQSNHLRHIRGIAKFSEKTLQLPLLGQGQLAITVIPKNSTERYQGVVAIKNNSLARSLEDYFIQSEQLNTRIWLFANDKMAAGLLLQEVPSSGTTDKNCLEHTRILADTLTSDEIFNLSFDEILNRLFANDPVRVFEPNTIEFKCSCDVEKMENAIRTMGQPEALEILQNRQVLDVTCEFCNRSYAFDKSDINRIFQSH